MKKQILLGFFGVLMITRACAIGAGTPTIQPTVDEAGTIVAATMQAFTAKPGENSSTQVPTPTQTSGTPVSFEHVSFVIPNGLASGVNPETVPAVSDGSGEPWEVSPAHLKFILTGYQLQEKFHEPGIYVYPADEYVKLQPTVSYQIDLIKRLLAGAPILRETLPRVPGFNAEAMIAANVQIISFQNGKGIRALTEYAQYYAPINNRELIYQFAGLTTDERYYIIAVLPITAPILAENERPDTPVPSGGVPIPTDVGPNETYYASITEKLVSLPPDSYTPSLNTLDSLIQSILVISP